MKTLLLIAAMVASLLTLGQNHKDTDHSASSDETILLKSGNDESVAPHISLIALSYYEGDCTLEGDISGDVAEVIDYGFILSSDMAHDHVRISVLHKDATAASDFFGVALSNISFIRLRNGNSFSLKVSLPQGYVKTITVRAYAVTKDNKSSVSPSKKGIELSGPKNSSTF